ncbi:MAG: hypothetical protein J3K34DRAFT_519072 [Monoraphidium minutum]|nr:MAG: hypothetical protein J3K34DRAFT_519072 [Monoraphidium minutum]
MALAASQQQQQQQQQQQRRRRLQQAPRGRGDDATAPRITAWDEAFLVIMCLGGVGLLAFVGYKGVAWYQRQRRPGYIELQDAAPAHRPWALA